MTEIMIFITMMFVILMFLDSKTDGEKRNRSWEYFPIGLSLYSIDARSRIYRQRWEQKTILHGLLWDWFGEDDGGDCGNVSR